MNMRRLLPILLVLLTWQVKQAMASEGFFETRADYRSPGLAISFSGLSVALQRSLGAGLMFGADNKVATHIGLALGLSGLVSGSSPGQFYAGATLKPIYFGVGRFALTVAAFSEYCARMAQTEEGAPEFFGPIQYACVGLAAGLLFWETVGTYFEAQRFNELHQPSKRSALCMITPSLIPLASRRTDPRPGMGLSFGMGF